MFESCPYSEVSNTGDVIEASAIAAGEQRDPQTNAMKQRMVLSLLPVSWKDTQAAMARAASATMSSEAIKC